MSNISRSAYQKLAEENKRLKKDIKSIALLEQGWTDIVRKWRVHFKKEKEFAKIMKDFAVQYFKEHPELDVTKNSRYFDSRIKRPINKGQDRPTPCSHAGTGMIPDDNNKCPICGGYGLPF